MFFEIRHKHEDAKAKQPTVLEFQNKQESKTARQWATKKSLEIQPNQIVLVFNYPRRCSSLNEHISQVFFFFHRCKPKNQSYWLAHNCDESCKKKCLILVAFLSKLCGAFNIFFCSPCRLLWFSHKTILFNSMLSHSRSNDYVASRIFT